jgi:hypothetical protein
MCSVVWPVPRPVSACTTGPAPDEAPDVRTLTGRCLSPIVGQLPILGEGLHLCDELHQVNVAGTRGPSPEVCSLRRSNARQAVVSVAVLHVGKAMERELCSC